MKQKVGKAGEDTAEQDLAHRSHGNKRRRPTTSPPSEDNEKRKRAPVRDAETRHHGNGDTVSKSEAQKTRTGPMAEDPAVDKRQKSIKSKEQSGQCKCADYAPVRVLPEEAPRRA